MISTDQAHSGTFSALVGNVSGGEPDGDSSFYQQITVPAAGGTLSFWHWDYTTDSITFDWQDAYITDSSGTILQTIFHQCLDGETWIQQNVDMAPYAGQTVRIKFLSHQDGFGDDTGMFVDDVTLGGTISCETPSATPTFTATSTPTNTPSATATGSPTCTPGNVVGNGGFETGTFPPWVIDGRSDSPVISTAQVHSGTFSALAGTVTGPEPLGDSSFYQQITVPAGGGTLSFWHWDFTTDSITFDWQDAYITDTSGTILTTIFHQCLGGNTWIQQNVDMTPYAGQTVRIKFLVHQDEFGDDTGMYVDDVTLGGGTCGTPSATPTFTATSTSTNTPTATATATSTATNTPTATATATPPTSIQFSSATYMEDESQTAVITITRTGDLSGTDTVQFIPTDGTAMGGALGCMTGVDYLLLPNPLVVFFPGDTMATALVPLCGDNITEPDETVILTLVGANLGTPSTAVLTINDTATRFRNGSNITINQNGAGNPYPSQITVAGGPHDHRIDAGNSL